MIWLLLLGGLLAYFGSRILQDRLSKAINIALWVLAGISAVMIVGLFAAESQLGDQGAQPTTGFYLALAGFIASVEGTMLVHSVRHKKATAGLSPPDTDIHL